MIFLRGPKPFPSNPTLNKIHSMSKILSIALFIAGVVLLVYGLNASGSFSSSVSRAVNGAPTDKTIWLIGLGIVGLVAGGFGLFRRGES
jgi:drug/metabolite transporter (DMT)-like permease